ncbi:MAG: RloB domain-containing protein [Rhodocyclaceae bacterium]|jgi:hypothetical protein|nr:MAG: RloB domain-containing protein [Rhodocyclaceae bacterium]
MASFGIPRSAKALKRKSRGFLELKRILIVCEGSKTEPHYLKALIRSLGLRATSVLVIGEECESAPISVYEYAEARFLEDPPFDEVFCVFDRDRHPSLDSACQAIESHASKLFKAIISHPCFEYWILLHFRYTRAPFVAQGANSPGAMVLKAVKEVWPQYAKGSSEVFAQLDKDNRLSLAIEHAKRAQADAKVTGELNPSTDFHTLVIRLQEVAKEQLQPQR